MNLGKQDREKILKRVFELIEKKHFNPAFNRSNWRHVLQKRTTRVLESKSPEDFEREMQDLVLQLGTSHTLFFHQNAQRMPSRYAICASFQQCQANGRMQWMFQDVHEEGPAYNAGLQPGDLLLAMDHKDLSPPLTPLFRMGAGTTLTVEKRDGRRVLVNLNIPEPKYKKLRPMCVPRLLSFRKLSDDIGWLKVTFFPGLVGIDVAHEIDEAIAHLHNCERLIVDLRGNYGGGIGCLRLMSYFTPDKVPVGYTVSRTLLRRLAGNHYNRESFVRFRKIPSSKFALIWLLLRYAWVDKSIVLITEGLGPQRFHGRMALLVNQHTTSASETVAGFVSRNKLAPIVGTKTPGYVLESYSFNAGHGYILRLPTSPFYLWEGDEMLEGKGVLPDILIDLSYDKLKDGRDNQLEKAIEVVRGM